ncbi:hyaluronan-binding protein 2-like [Hippocampus comes]|uniref:hyaluronan-binding protein 2-like n=1 Tax=Hippocampus comes TaxID=109280 RepID=UPI00094E4C13|nr:PREDICTED: hyaluronan-binding protein 2-like [Hippocampus comes]
MLSAGLLLVCVSLLGVQGIRTSLDGMDSDDGQHPIRKSFPRFFSDTTSWVRQKLTFRKEPELCDPNPCFHNGQCNVLSDKVTCSCREPFMGDKCQKAKDVCKDMNCHFGDCVLNSAGGPECKCTYPYLGTNCLQQQAVPCSPNPCHNGGVCMEQNRHQTMIYLNEALSSPS